MNCNIVRIDILGLYGVRDYSIRFNQNKLILVGENGAGKTTISRIIYATLSCNWDMLRTYPFNKIVIYFDNQSIEISSSLISNIFSTPDIDRIEFFMNRRFTHSNFDGFIAAVLDAKNQIEKSEKPENNIYSSKRLHTAIPYEYISEVIKDPNITRLYDLTNEIQKKFNVKILYLPTYRRIEEQLKTIIDIDDEEWEKKRKKVSTDKVIELVEFGMNDVEQLVKKEEDALKSFSQTQQNKLTLGYLSEIVSENYNQSSSYTKIRELSDNQIHEVLRRIDSTILSDEMKQRVLKILNFVRKNQKSSRSTQRKIVCHYFLQLMEFNQEITSSEQNIRKFQEICNKYLVNNKLIYNSKDFTCQAFNQVGNCSNNEYPIHFQDLSSGEKQIVSLFSHLYLDKDMSLFVFIDEPELSLSVDWQRMILPDIANSPKCVGLIATTHSPFIFDNELESVVHGINEFCTRG